jgi:hypothetical protein
MSRSGYTDDCIDDPLQYGRYRGRVASAKRGKRGQAMLVALRDALDALEVKELYAEVIVQDDGCCCAMGALLKHRGLYAGYVGDPSEYLDERNEDMAKDLDVAECLVAEIVYENDEGFSRTAVGKTEAEARWHRMRSWVDRQIVDDSMDGVSITTEASSNA